MAIFAQLSYCWPYLILTITKNCKNGCHDSKPKDKDVQGRPTTHEVGSFLKLNMLSAVMDGSYYQKPQNDLTKHGEKTT